MDTMLFSDALIGNLVTYWVRCNHQGTSLIFNNYSVYGYNNSFLIDLQTGLSKELKLDLDNEHSWSNSFPHWSPDDKHIVYLSGDISKEAGSLYPYGYVHLLKIVE